MNVRTALLGLFVVLTIVLASTTVYELDNRQTQTSTSTLTKTSTQIPPSPLGTTTLVSNSSLGLGLSLQVNPGLNGNYTFTVSESNLLNSVKNVTGADKWAYTQHSLIGCSPDGSFEPVDFAVVQGHYGANNYTSSQALPFYHTDVPILYCAEPEPPGGPYTYSFQPLNYTFSFASGSNFATNGAALAIITTSGYWTGGQFGVAVAFKPFPRGVYTVIAADEWGDVVLLQTFLG